MCQEAKENLCDVLEQYPCCYLAIFF